MYLLMARCLMDDLPLYLGNRKRCLELIVELQTGTKKARKLLSSITKRLNIDVSEICNLSIYRFDAAGVLVEVDYHEPEKVNDLMPV